MCTCFLHDSGLRWQVQRSGLTGFPLVSACPLSTSISSSAAQKEQIGDQPAGNDEATLTRPGYSPFQVRLLGGITHPNVEIRKNCKRLKMRYRLLRTLLIFIALGYKKRKLAKLMSKTQILALTFRFLLILRFNAALYNQSVFCEVGCWTILLRTKARFWAKLLYSIS